MFVDVNFDALGRRFRIFFVKGLAPKLLEQNFEKLPSWLFAFKNGESNLLHLVFWRSRDDDPTLTLPQQTEDLEEYSMWMLSGVVSSVVTVVTGTKMVHGSQKTDWHS